MRSAFLILAIVLSGHFVCAQETVTEVSTTDEGLTLKKTLDLDLRLLKETYYDKNKAVVEYYTYNPVSGELEGGFNNGFFSGTIKNGLITSDNYIKFITPSDNQLGNMELLIRGNISSGKLNGDYDIYNRTYKKEYQYDHASTIINTYIKGEYTKTYSAFVDKNNFSENRVGNITFQDGKYVAFNFHYNGIRYTANYANGLVTSFVRYDLEAATYIDSISTSGKLYMKNGKYIKNKYAGFISDLDSLRNGKIGNCRNVVEANVVSTKSTQDIPYADPLNNVYQLVSRSFNSGLSYNDYVWRWVSYIKEDYSTIWFIPLSGGYIKQVGIDNYDGYNAPTPIPTTLKLVNVVACNASNKVVGGNMLFKIPVFEYQINLEEILTTNGSQKGYSNFYHQIIDGMGKKAMIEIFFSDPATEKMSIGSYDDIENYPNK